MDAGHGRHRTHTDGHHSNEEGISIQARRGVRGQAHGRRGLQGAQKALAASKLETRVGRIVYFCIRIFVSKTIQILIF